MFSGIVAAIGRITHLQALEKGLRLTVEAPGLDLTDVALGTIAKTMPTMNVFFVGFPIKIGGGLTVMAMSLPLFAYVIEKAVGYFDNELRMLLYSLGGA